MAVPHRIALAVMLAALAAPTISSQQPHSVPSPDSAHSSPAAIVDPRAAQPERPTVATHAYTVAPGYVEIEAGVQEARPQGASQFVAPVVAKLGITPRLQLELQGGYENYGVPGHAGSANTGVTDLAVALKQRVLRAAPVLHDFSIQAALKFPSGARGVGTGTTDLSLVLISSRPIGAAELDLNAGYTHRSGDGTSIPTSATLLTASFGTPIHGPVSGVAELFTFPRTGGPAGAPTVVGFIIGPTLQLMPSLVLDAGAILNVAHMGANAAYLGVTYNAGRIPGFPPPHR
ncbi:MAG: transporter [Gemmatimonadota bacterium]|nr:transporter [Gemmatimonadota bacterium]